MTITIKCQKREMTVTTIRSLQKKKKFPINITTFSFSFNIFDLKSSKQHRLGGNCLQMDSRQWTDRRGRKIYRFYFNFTRRHRFFALFRLVKINFLEKTCSKFDHYT